jgi:hypothetical protein
MMTTTTTLMTLKAPERRTRTNVRRKTKGRRSVTRRPR